jgi:PAS domain S-box-containing protein
MDVDELRRLSHLQLEVEALARMNGSDESGKKQFVGKARDASPGNESEIDLETSERRMRMILQSADMVLWEADPNTLQFRFVSDHCEKLLGFTKSQWLEPNFWQVCLHPQDASEVTMARKQFLSRITDQPKAAVGSGDIPGKPIRMEYRLIRKDSRAVWVEEVTQYSIESDGSKSLRGLMLDITERRTLGEQFRQSQKREAIGRLAGGVAHGFNNLLTVILSYGELMLMRLPSDHPNRPWVESICDASQRGSALTRQLLAYSRKAAVAPQRIDLNELIRGAELLLRPAIGDGIQLIVKTDPRLRPIRADRMQIEQILMNLAVNARDAMSGNGTLRIETNNAIDSTVEWAREPGSNFVELIFAPWNPVPHLLSRR